MCFTQQVLPFSTCLEILPVLWTTFASFALGRARLLKLPQESLIYLVIRDDEAWASSKSDVALEPKRAAFHVSFKSAPIK